MLSVLQFLLRPSSVFCASLIYSGLLFLIQAEVGMGVGFHVDENTYIQKSVEVCANSVTSIGAVFNRGFYCWVAALDVNVPLLIALNVIVYAMTNWLIAKKIVDSKSGILMCVLTLCLIFDPYRAHLSVHLLKDTLIIGLIVGLFCYPKVGPIWFLLVETLRVASVVYLLPLFRIGPLFWLFLLIGFALGMILEFDRMKDLLFGNVADMVFRDYDNVSTFTEFGVFGSVLRATVWPILSLSGIFVIVSPSIFFVPMALSALVLQSWSLMRFRRLAVNAEIYLALAAIAFLMPGFTTYERYVYPVLTVIPIILARRIVSTV